MIRCINDLEAGNAEGCRLACTRLRLCNRVTALADLNDCSRLDSRWRLVSIGVNAAQQALFQGHVFKSWCNGDLFRGRKLHFLCSSSAGCGLPYGSLLTICISIDSSHFDPLWNALFSQGVVAGSGRSRSKRNPSGCEVEPQRRVTRAIAQYQIQTYFFLGAGITLHHTEDLQSKCCSKIKDTYMRIWSD